MSELNGGKLSPANLGCFTPGKRVDTDWMEGLLGPQKQSGHCGELKAPLSLLRIEP
jgi:hypothetical protein